MPLTRYFIFVGGVLLALMFIAGAFLPKLPVEVKADSEHPPIRIHSDQKWPERVVFDTSRPTIVPPQRVAIAPSAPTPVAVEAGDNARARNAFASLELSDHKQAQLSDAAKLERKPQHKRKIAKRRLMPPMMMAQQPQFSFFGNGWNSTW